MGLIKGAVHVALVAGFSSLLESLPRSIRLDIRSRTPVIVDLDYETSPVKVEVSSDLELKRRVNACAREPATVKWIESMRPGDVLWDVGANIGAYSLIAAAAHQGLVRVYAFEPAWPNYRQLCANVTLNCMDEVVTPLPVALAELSGLVEFEYHNLLPGGALHSIAHHPNYRDEAPPALRQRVLAVTATDAVQEFGLPLPTHIKLDVDGGEMHVLRGAEGLLRRLEVRSLSIEVDTPDVDDATDVTDYLKDFNFTLESYERLQGSPTSRAAKQLNLVFQRVAA